MLRHTYGGGWTILWSLFSFCFYVESGDQSQVIRLAWQVTLSAKSLSALPTALKNELHRANIILFCFVFFQIEYCVGWPQTFCLLPSTCCMSPREWATVLSAKLYAQTHVCSAQNCQTHPLGLSVSTTGTWQELTSVFPFPQLCSVLGSRRIFPIPL